MVSIIGLLGETDFQSINESFCRLFSQMSITDNGWYSTADRWSPIWCVMEERWRIDALYDAWKFTGVSFRIRGRFSLHTIRWFPTWRIRRFSKMLPKNWNTEECVWLFLIVLISLLMDILRLNWYYPAFRFKNTSYILKFYHFSVKYQ